MDCTFSLTSPILIANPVSKPYVILYILFSTVTTDLKLAKLLSDFKLFLTDETFILSFLDHSVPQKCKIANLVQFSRFNWDLKCNKVFVFMALPQIWHFLGETFHQNQCKRQITGACPIGNHVRKSWSIVLANFSLVIGHFLIKLAQLQNYLRKTLVRLPRTASISRSEIRDYRNCRNILNNHSKLCFQDTFFNVAYFW